MSKNSNQMAELFTYISANQSVYFATTHDKQPKIRPMTMFYFRGRFFMVTFSSDSKINQIKNNKLCEVLLPIKDEYDNEGYVKMIGTAKICTDPDLRADATDFCYFFDEYYKGADDPDFCLIELTFDTYEMLKPGDNHKTVVK